MDHCKSDPATIKILRTSPMPEDNGNIIKISFDAPNDVLEAIKDQAVDLAIKFANGPLHLFFISENNNDNITNYGKIGMDIDVEMPYGNLQPFGREDTAQELTQ